MKIISYTHTYIGLHTYIHACIHTYILTYTHRATYTHIHRPTCIHYRRRPTFIVHTHNETLLLGIVGSCCWHQIYRKPPITDVLFWISPSEFAFTCCTDRDMCDPDFCTAYRKRQQTKNWRKDSHTCKYYIADFCHMLCWRIPSFNEQRLTGTTVGLLALEHA